MGGGHAACADDAADLSHGLGSAPNRSRARRQNSPWPSAGRAPRRTEPRLVRRHRPPEVGGGVRAPRAAALVATALTAATAATAATATTVAAAAVAAAAVGTRGSPAECPGLANCGGVGLSTAIAQGAAANLGGSQLRLGGGTRCGPLMAQPPGPRMAHQGANAAGAQVDQDDDVQDLPQYGHRFDEGRMQLSVPWQRWNSYFRTQNEIMSDQENTVLLQNRLSTLKSRMQWWFLIPGLPVYGLAMERWDAPVDRTVYPVHPSR